MQVYYNQCQSKKTILYYMSPPISKIRKYNERIVIFYDKGCHYSEDAIKLLKQKKVLYRAYEIKPIADELSALITYFNQPDIAAETGFDPQHRTKPIVFNCGRFIGGFTELKRLLEN
jgi:glutaredoxin